MSQTFANISEKDKSDKSRCRNLIDIHPDCTDGRKTQFQLILSVFILLGIEEKISDIQLSNGV